ncbi:major facilitator superfamily transporter [Pseudomassariella vexata]|uniref:Major facilitator superfamily transporter n=1 Tax=Pseudomassariella vexata TaxID=1141098 RepID=A0A1Y2EAC7_9PEZI|nr:major facilitator superfamily transporter [Pseudomassariella vexata]ORY68509.1 major facilitator superfamily transporter [Pseudomassariella vexata]
MGKIIGTMVQIVSKVDEADQLASIGLERDADGFIRWRSDSPDHPRNWSTNRKIFDTVIIIFLEFYVTIIATTGAAVAHEAGPEFGLERRVAIISFTFMYNFGQAIGGCLIPPLSELLGRRTPYLISCATFSIFCLFVGIVPHVSAVWIGRFVAGFASAVPAVVTAGSVEDIFNTKRRVWIVILWNAGSTAGLCFGPVYAAHISSAFGWRWVYYSSAFVCAAIFICLLTIRESRPSKLLKTKISKLREQGKIENLEWNNPDHFPNVKVFLDLVAVRPVRLLGSEPLVMMVTTVFAVSWGMIYFFTEALTDVYMSMGWSRTQASLPFLAIASGIPLTFLPRIWDMKIVKSRQSKQQVVEPEDKIMGFSWAAPALAGGLIWFAWTVPPIVHVVWIVPTLALVPIGFAVNEMAYTLSGYLADSYLLYSASAFCGLAFVRAIVSGLMPLIAYELYGGLGANFSGTVVAGLSVLFCATPWVFFRYSKQLRERSPFACHSLQTHLRTQIERD